MIKTTLWACMLTAFILAIPSSAQAADRLTKKEVEKIIADYVKGNPEILIESLENYRIKQEEMQQASAQEKVKMHRAFLEAADAPSIGNPKADVTVVEFFDYNCGYCRRAVPDIQAMIKDDKNVRFVFHEMPILSPNSREVALWSLASHEQGKYFEFHAALMKYRGTRNAKTMKELAKDVGLDPKKLEKDANSTEIKAALEKGSAVANEVGVRGTPAFIINGEIYPGYLGPEGLARAIESARQKL